MMKLANCPIVKNKNELNRFQFAKWITILLKSWKIDFRCGLNIIKLLELQVNTLDIKRVGGCAQERIRHWGSGIFLLQCLLMKISRELWENIRIEDLKEIFSSWNKVFNLAKKYQLDGYCCSWTISVALACFTFGRFRNPGESSQQWNTIWKWSSFLFFSQLRTA